MRRLDGWDKRGWGRRERERGIVWLRREVYRKFGLAGPFLHRGRNRCSVYMCVARLIRRRCSLVWHGTLPRRDWSPIKVSATFILGQGERLRAFFSLSRSSSSFSSIARDEDRRCRTRHMAISVNRVCSRNIFLASFFFKGIWFVNLGIVMVESEFNFEWFDEWFVYICGEIEFEKII